MLEGTLELKDPDHPQAIRAADATARLLLEVHERRQRQGDQPDDAPEEESESNEAA